jgi:recombinational DNA repair ATPase RecF
MRIIKLEAQNIMRLKAVTIQPKGATTLIGGRNAQGKSSALRAIEMALGGTKSIPDQPIRQGAKKGHVVDGMVAASEERGAAE